MRLLMDWLMNQFYLLFLIDQCLKLLLTHAANIINNTMHNISESIATQAITHLLKQLDKQLALLQIAQLAPTNTAGQANHAITTMVYISFAQRFSHAGKLPQQKDPRPARIDNFGCGKVEREQVSPVGQNKGSRVSDKDKEIERMRSLATQRSKNSFRSGRFVPDASFRQPSPSVKQGNQSVKSKEVAPASSFLISLYPEAEVDRAEQNMRQAENERVALQARTKKQHDEESKQREKSAALGMKLVREKKPFTFDYQGASQGINPVHLPADMLRKMKQELRNVDVMKKDRMCETTQIPNLRHKQQLARSIKGDLPVFSQKTFSVVQALGDDSHLAQGVKITQLRGNSNNVTLQHHTKRPQNKPYRLKDYKNLSKQKSFQEFPLASSRKSSMLQLTSSAIDNQQDIKLKTLRKDRPFPPPKSRGKSQQMMKLHKASMREEALGRGLPFIRTKGLKFYDIGSASSLKTVDFSFNSSERKSHWKSKIKITDILLYEDILLG